MMDMFWVKNETMFTFVVRWWPLVAGVNITAAKEEVRDGRSGYAFRRQLFASSVQREVNGKFL